MMRKIIASVFLLFICGHALAQPAIPGEPDTERRTRYTATAQTGPFSVGFDLYGDGSDYQNWIKVYVNGAEMPQSGNWAVSSTSGTIGSLPRPITNATVTFTSPQTGTVDIVGARRPRRTSQFTENRPITAHDQNQVLTDLWMTQRERWDQNARALIAPPGEAIAPLPSATARAGGLLAFDNSGNPVATGPLNSNGNVMGPNGATNNDLTCFNGTTGNLIKSCGNQYLDGVFNVRLQYKAKPDGSTDNSTAIAAAFAVSNTFVSGVPTVYFDCDTSQTTCVYNYGGSGISPINPLVATSIVCAPGATLNYTGSAHAADIGPVGLTINNLHATPYKIQGCTFKGGATYTQGIYINDYLIETDFSNNVFYNFGNRTGYTIYYTGNNWETVIAGNFWTDTDGLTKNMVDGHLIQSGALRFTNNTIDCVWFTGGIDIPCSVSTVGVGLWAHSAWITNNTFQAHYPLLRIAGGTTSVVGGPIHVINNHFEGNSLGLSPLITYGDPGGAPFTSIGATSTFISNYFFAPQASTIPIVGPEASSVGTYSLNSTYWDHNTFGTQFGFNAAEYINTSGGGDNLIGYNQDSSNSYISQNSTIPITDSPNAQKYAAISFPRGGSTTLGGRLAAWSSAGDYLEPSSLTQVQGPMLCANTIASGTAQVCNTSPRFTPGGTDVTLAPGNIIIYSTNTTNTGSLVITVNGTAYTVKKSGGTSNLSAGDIKSGIPYILGSDGTNLNIANN